MVISTIFANAQWQQTNGPLGGRINCFAVSGTNIFTAVMGGGVFLSTDSANNWTAVNNGLTSQDISSLAVIGTDIFAGIYQGGVWKRSLSEMTEGIEELENINDVVIYPNPANDKITIDKHSLNMNKGEEISIYNLQGKLLLKQIIYQVKTDINISALVNGMYFIKLVGEEGIVIKKFVKE